MYLYKKNEENIVTQFTMGTFRRTWIIEDGFLGLRTLTVMRDAVANDKRKQGNRHRFR